MINHSVTVHPVDRNVVWLLFFFNRNIFTVLYIFHNIIIIHFYLYPSSAPHTHVYTILPYNAIVGLRLRKLFTLCSARSVNELLIYAYETFNV